MDLQLCLSRHGALSCCPAISQEVTTAIEQVPYEASFTTLAITAADDDDVAAGTRRGREPVTGKAVCAVLLGIG
jgi:hypothetical protein